MIHFIIGVAATVLFWWLMHFSQKKDIHLSHWKKALTVGGILYAVFVMEVIVGFIHEQELKAALVMGSTTGIFAVIWGVVLYRFVFSKQLKTQKVN